jgi:MFS family permease
VSAAGEARGVDRRELALLAVVVVIGVAGRVALLREPMRYDEAFSFLRYAMLSPDVIRHSYDLPNNHVLNTLLMHDAWQAFGTHVWTVRLPAFALGSLVPVASWLAGRELYGPRAGLWAAALTAAFGPLVEFSVNGRGYAIGALFVVLSLWAGARILAGDRAPAVAAFVVSATLALYAVPTMVYGLGAVGVFLAAGALLGRDWRGVLTLVLGAGLAALFTWLLYRPLFGQPGWTIQPPLPDVWHLKTDLARSTWEVWNRTTPHPLDWIAALGFVASVPAHGRIGRHPAPLGLAVVLTIAAILLVVDRLPPFPRGYVALLPLYLIAAGAGLAWLIDVAAARTARPALLNGGLAAVAAAVIAASLLHAGLKGSEAPPQSDNGLMAYLKGELKPGEVLMNQHTFAPAVNFYFFRDGYPNGRGEITPPMRQTGHAVVIVQGDRPQEAVGTVESVGGIPGKGPPRLLKRFEYISVWDVPVAG